MSAAAAHGRRWPRALDLRASLCLGYLLLIGIVGLCAPLIAPYSPFVQDANNILLPPDPAHLSAPTTSGATC